MQQTDAIFFTNRSRRDSGPVASWTLWIASIAALAGGCGPAPMVSLSNPDPSGKIPAIKRAAQSRDPRAAPQLIKELESDDPAVRFYAIQALRRVTGEDFGYRYYEDDEHREPAVKRWQDWLARQPSRGP